MSASGRRKKRDDFAPPFISDCFTRTFPAILTRNLIIPIAHVSSRLFRNVGAALDDAVPDARLIHFRGRLRWRLAVSRSSEFRRTRLWAPRDSNAFSTHRQDRPIGKLLRVISEQPFHEVNAPCGGNVGEPHKSTMRRLLDKDKLSEILIHGHKDTPLQHSPVEQNPIPWIGTALA